MFTCIKYLLNSDQAEQFFEVRLTERTLPKTLTLREIIRLPHKHKHKYSGTDVSWPSSEDFLGDAVFWELFRCLKWLLGESLACRDKNS